MPKKLSIDYIKDICFKRGFELVNILMSNNGRIIEAKCIKQHIFKKSIYNIDSQCQKCLGVNVRISQQQVIEELAKYNYKLDDTYIRNHDPIWVLCPLNHRVSMSRANFYSGSRCVVCFGNPKKNIHIISKEAKEHGFTLLSTQYKGNQKHHLYKCDKVGHVITTKPNSIKNGLGCLDCSGLKRKDQAEIEKEAHDHNYTIIGKYINRHTKLKYLCPKKHEIKMDPHSFRKGHRCAKCMRSIKESKGELEILNYVKQYYPDTIKWKNFVPGRRFELDIYIPSINKAIEYDGFYHQRTTHIKSDSIKNEYCKKMGIKLLRIKDEDYRKNKEIIKQQVLEFLKT